MRIRAGDILMVLFLAFALAVDYVMAGWYLVIATLLLWIITAIIALHTTRRSIQRYWKKTR